MKRGISSDFFFFFFLLSLILFISRFYVIKIFRFQGSYTVLDKIFSSVLKLEGFCLSLSNRSSNSVKVFCLFVFSELFCSISFYPLLESIMTGFPFGSSFFLQVLLGGCRCKEFYIVLKNKVLNDNHFILKPRVGSSNQWYRVL